MAYLKKIFVIFCLMISAIAVKAQQFMHYPDSRPVLVIDYSDIGGTPYLYEDFTPGSFILSNGFKSEGAAMLRLNLVKDLLTFKDAKTGAEMEFVVPVQEFTLNANDANGPIARHFKIGYKDIEGTTPASFFEVLADGKTQLIKKTVKMLLETVVIGAPTKEKKFIEKSTRYYLVKDEKATSIKTDKKSVMAALADKQTQIDNYIKSNKPNFKNDAELVKLISYYNSL